MEAQAKAVTVEAKAVLAVTAEGRRWQWQWQKLQECRCNHVGGCLGGGSGGVGDGVVSLKAVYSCGSCLHDCGDGLVAMAKSAVVVDCGQGGDGGCGILVAVARLRRRVGGVCRLWVFTAVWCRWFGDGDDVG